MTLPLSQLGRGGPGAPFTTQQPTAGQGVALDGAGRIPATAPAQAVPEYTADPATPSNGMAWTRSDLAAIKARINGSTRAFPSMLTGIVTGATGVVVAGGGFSVSRSSAGVYVFTYTVDFPAAPAVFATPVQAARLAPDIQAAAGASGCTILWLNTAAAAADTDFHFLAVAMV